MISKDLQVLIHHLELFTRKTITGPLLGDARSTLKGSGFEFNQLRDYVQGDDIRFIDWHASARSNKMLVRQYLEDRNRMVYIAVDISASTCYGSGALKSDLIKQLAAVLAFLSFHKKDSVGLILFSDSIEKVIPPRQSRNHVFSLVKTLFSYSAKERTTNLAVPVEYIGSLRGQKALICMISDFMAPLDQRMLSVAARRHDLMAFRCLDPREWSFPQVGTLIFEDSETGLQATIPGGFGCNQALELWHRQQKEYLAAARVDSLDLIVGTPYTGALVSFLRQRVFS